jgi:hypothetical protein
MAEVLEGHIREHLFSAGRKKDDLEAVVAILRSYLK